ncbi:MAG TPA: hypothetical protein VFJ64_04710 [Solirubrobacterales bacterium]|nr:hypothetical protein [Solirubrobacterales bacterium]
MAWRTLAEDRARLEQGVTASLVTQSHRLLAPCQRAFGRRSSDLHQDLCDFLWDVGAPLTWGRHYESVRMVLYEISLNAIQHGKAQHLEIESNGTSVTVRDDGQPFGIDKLKAGGRGGNRAVSDLEVVATGTFSVRSRRQDDLNQWTVVDEIASNGANTPCSMAVDVENHQIARQAYTQIRVLANCPEVHVYVPNVWSYSDWFNFLGVVEDEMAGRRLVIHGLSRESPLADLIIETYDRAHFPD